MSDWPCERRVAHGPHPLPSGDDLATMRLQCPGVKAHPSTMIGRSALKEAEESQATHS